VPSPDYDQRKAKTWDYYYPGQMQPGPYSGQPLKWYEVWLKALTPSVDAYHQILADPTWTVNRAYMWLILGMVINVIMDMVMGGGNLKTTSNFAGNNSTNYNYNAGSSLCCLPVSIGLGMLFFMIFAFITHAIAQAFGGRSDMNRLIYAIAAFSVPIALISWIPCVGFIVSLYALVLMVVAVKAVYEIGWFGATVSGLWPIPVFLICIFCFVFALAGAIAS
jgi:hypothetical protein